MKKFCFHLIIGVLLQPLGRRVDLEGYYKAIVTPGTCVYYVHVFQINSKRTESKLLLLLDNGIAYIIESVQNVSCFFSSFFRRALEIEPIENVVVLKFTYMKHARGTV